jgi:hypothetical protein
MSRKLLVATALAVCLALVFAVISASDRTRTRGERGLSGSAGRVAVDVPDMSQVRDPRFARQLNPVIEIGAGGVAQSLSAGWVAGDSAEKKASAYMAIATNQEPEQAYHTLQRVLELGLEDGTEKSRRLLAEAYKQLADLTEDPGRQTYMLNKAVACLDESPIRTEIEARIVALGGMPDVVNIQQANGASTIATPADFGMDDSCTGATPVGVPSITNMSIADPINGFEDVNFLEIVIEGPLGVALEIETTSPYCDSDMSCSADEYDTDMNLYALCENGFPDMLVARDINRGDGGLGWLSKIETTCLLPDSYYLEVMGQYGNAPKDFNVEVRAIGSCEVPLPDAYEPDNTSADASKIGKPSSVPDHASAWGRANSEIQDHTIFPRNDEDNMEINLTRTETVKMGTQIQFANPVAHYGKCLGDPTISCVNFLDCNPPGGPYIYDCWFGDYPAGPDEDSQLFLYYGSDPHGGVCNSSPLSLGNYCKSSDDCDPGATPAIPSLPADYCVPLWALVFNGEPAPRFEPENPLAYNDDASGDNLGSEIEMCLPRTASGGPSLSVQEGMIMRTRGWRPPFPGSTSDLVYEYQSLSRTTAPCLFEQEVNNVPWTATPFATNVWVYGINDISETLPFADQDFWGPFDVAEGGEEVVVQVFPKLINPLGDSEIDIWVGPDDTGNYYFVATEEPDTGNEPNSFMTLTLPPANEYVGNTMAQAGYYIAVYGLDVVPNWYYQMRVLTPLIKYDEVEPNDIVPNDPGFRGKTIIDAAIDVTCDIDRFQFTVPSNMFLDMWTSDPSTDTVLNFQRIGVDFAGTLKALAPDDIYGTYGYGTAAYGPRPTLANFNGLIETVDDGDGNSFGCTPPVNDLSGKIAVADRGVCGFAVKTELAQGAGATAVLVANDRDQDITNFVMGGDCPGCTIASLIVSQEDGALFKSYEPETEVVYYDEQLACDDDGYTEGGNPYLSRITGCVSPGDYVVSVRGWNASGGPYVLSIVDSTGAAGCTPTEPPTMNDTGTGSSSFCPPNYPFERFCE